MAILLAAMLGEVLAGSMTQTTWSLRREISIGSPGEGEQDAIDTPRAPKLLNYAKQNKQRLTV